MVSRRKKGATSPSAGAPGRLDVLSSDTTTGSVYGPGPDTVAGELPRLARHQISLADGHRVGVSVCGRGVPIVLIHGFTAEGMLYAQCLSRIVAAGFKVVAIDSASHGSTQGLPTGGADFEEYSKLVGRVVDELGIKQAIFAGHSMGGRLVTELAAREPERALAVILLDAIVGEPWDRIVALSRFNPFLLAGVGAILMADSLSTVPFVRDPRQALKFGHLAMPTFAHHVRHPLHLAGPGISILRSKSSKWMLQKLGAAGVPVVAIHGDRDIVVPLATARSAAKLSGGMVVVVEGGTHSWLLKDPETLPAILRQMFDHPDSRAARDRDFAKVGLAPDAPIDEIEAAFYDEDAVVLGLTPPFDPDAIVPGPRKPRYRWHVDVPG
ncbi:alpha/beta hydrolase [Aquihabitans sp. G128]|uniref:alpha/beta fold hydrolase n=1 Tax=Aquihabitans sp. G128 TaxID=2849779 RepID=UPI001C2361C7|nr:alpha/beta hydrolase [Aquihabitans sp. G128]QXC62443.1 alpha/beta hydrolase [Aquihabitans sp. G128]